MFSAYKSLRLAIVIYDSNNAGGAWRSISTYHKFADLKGDPVRLINRNARRTFRQVIAATVAAPRILLNGMDSFYRWEAILLALLRPSTLIYLHETDYMLNAFQRNAPFRYRLVSRILKRNPVLAVSRQAAELYRSRFGSADVHVVYECLPQPASPPSQKGRRQICMVGTIDRRKGVELFSRLADHAAENDLPWDFHWIGGKGSREEPYQSPRVNWWGWQDNPRDFVSHCDLFLLASIDDPFPLACLEALRDHRRCVAYTGTGVSEILGSLPGCAVFSEHSTEAAAEAIRTALDGEPDGEAIDRLFDELLDVTAFRQRLHAILSGDSSPSPVTSS